MGRGARLIGSARSQAQQAEPGQVSKDQSIQSFLRVREAPISSTAAST